MTISSLLGLRGATSTTASPAALGHGLGGLGGLGHRAPSLHGAQNRGDLWIQSEGWKGGKKGDSAALSALTLLAFLFFLHILQSCLQDINNQQPTIVMATGGARREEVPTMVAVPVATPMPMPMPAAGAGGAGAGAAGAPMMVAMAPVRARRHVHSEELARHLQRVRQQGQQGRHGQNGQQAGQQGRQGQNGQQAGQQGRHGQNGQQVQQGQQGRQSQQGQLGQHGQQQGQQGQRGDAGWEMVSVVASGRRPPARLSDRLQGLQPASSSSSSNSALVAVGLTTPRHSTTTSTAAPLTPFEAEAGWPEPEERVVSITPRPSASAEAGTAMVRVSSSVSSVEAEDDSAASSSSSSETAFSSSFSSAANKQEEYELLRAAATTERIETATPVPAVAAAVPVAVLPMRPTLTFVPLARPLASTVRGVFSMLAAPLLRMMQPAMMAAQPGAPAKVAPVGLGAAAALGAGLGAGLREGLRTAICCDLVVCEAHRLGSIGGRIGERVASTVSSVVRWMCGEAEEGELKAAALRGQGRAASESTTGSATDERGGCRYHIERCERRAGRRTAVTTIASLLEAYVTGGSVTH